jgi:hypothetical protein
MSPVCDVIFAAGSHQNGTPRGFNSQNQPKPVFLPVSKFPDRCQHGLRRIDPAMKAAAAAKARAASSTPRTEVSLNAK